MTRTRTKKAFGWGVALAGVAAVFAFLGDFFGVYDRFFGRPEVTLMSPREPGVGIEFDPTTKTMAFEVSFVAENSGKRNETIRSIRGSLDSRTAAVMHFLTTDADCKVDGNVWSSIPMEDPQSVRCRFSNDFTQVTRDKLAAPGPLVLKIRVEGGRGGVYPLRYCISATDDFWKDFLASRTKATRQFLNPRDCD